MPGPFSKSDTQFKTLMNPTQTYPASARSLTWWTSPRVDGKLQLQSNPHTRVQHVVLAYRRTFHPNWGPVYLAPANPVWASSDFQRTQAQAKNLALKRFEDKLRSGNAAGWGVGLSQWRQSWDMISKRANQVAKIAQLASKLHRPRGRSSKGRPRTGSSADHFLEYQFGWAPLISDIHTTALILAGDAPSGRLTGRGRSSATKHYTSSTQQASAFAEFSSTYSAYVQVNNSNVWLLNQLGLLNPALVVWDIIPWSFVVGWFGNFSQVLGSFTSYSGLTLSQGSYVTKMRYWDTLVQKNTYPPTHPGFAQSEKTLYLTHKSQDVGPPPAPSFLFSYPKWQMTRSLISVSLMMQQISRLKP